MEITDEQWAMVRRIVPRAIRSSLHCSISSINEDGSPHVTPIGSFLPTTTARGVYIDVFNAQLAAQVDRDPRVTILALDSGPGRWARSFLTGTFVAPPGVRLVGTVGPRRPSTQQEIDRFHRPVGPLRRTRGGRRRWASLAVTRDVEIERVVPIRMGRMTRGLEARPGSR